MSLFDNIINPIEEVIENIVKDKKDKIVYILFYQKNNASVVRAMNQTSFFILKNINILNQNNKDIPQLTYEDMPHLDINNIDIDKYDKCMTYLKNQLEITIYPTLIQVKNEEIIGQMEAFSLD